MDYLSDGNRTLIWVGIPNDDNPDVTARMKVQDEVVRAEVAKRPNVVFVDTWARFSGRNGGWAEFVVDPRDGEGKDVRADDGFHLNQTGAEIHAIDIAEAVKAARAARIPIIAAVRTGHCVRNWGAPEAYVANRGDPFASATTRGRRSSRDVTVAVRVAVSRLRWMDA